MQGSYSRPSICQQPDDLASSIVVLFQRAFVESRSLAVQRGSLVILYDKKSLLRRFYGCPVLPPQEGKGYRLALRYITSPKHSITYVSNNWTK